MFAAFGAGKLPPTTPKHSARLDSMTFAKHIDIARALRPQGPGMRTFVPARNGNPVESPRDALGLHD